MQVVGKRHYGQKAVPQGGGGGRQATRELFDTLLLWQARVPLDADGEATVEVPLNDSLTSFRIVAVATGGVGACSAPARTSIRTTQDLMLLPGLAAAGARGRSLPRRVHAAQHDRRARWTSTVRGARRRASPAPLAPQTRRRSPRARRRSVGWDVDRARRRRRRSRWDVEAAASAAAPPITCA